ncbi:5683_t:CDS:2, partial [Cetraspora pellucida]
MARLDAISVPNEIPFLYSITSNIVALNWISQKPGITSPLLGVKTKDQLEENLKALEFKLTPEQMARLDAVSSPKEIPFPYNFFGTAEYYIGKNIQQLDKFKP